LFPWADEATGATAQQHSVTTKEELTDEVTGATAQQHSITTKEELTDVGTSSDSRASFRKDPGTVQTDVSASRGAVHPRAWVGLKRKSAAAEEEKRAMVQICVHMELAMSKHNLATEWLIDDQTLLDIADTHRDLEDTIQNGIYLTEESQALIERASKVAKRVKSWF